MSPDAGADPDSIPPVDATHTARTGGPRPGTRGMLLVRAGAQRARDWALDGVGPVVVVPDPSGWTVVVPLGEKSFAEPPFDDGVGVLLGRPVRRRLIPTIGVAVVGARLAVSVVQNALRPHRVWLVWEPGNGLIRPPGLAPGTVAQLVAAAGSRDQRAAAARILADGRGTAERVLEDLCTMLALPGMRLITQAHPALSEPGAVLVEPAREDVARFDRIVHEVRRWREEVEGAP